MCYDQPLGGQQPFPVPLDIFFEIVCEAFPHQDLDQPEDVGDVKYIDEDKRVCFVTTPTHGYYVLATNLTQDLVMGVVIGEEDEGLVEEMQAALGWDDAHFP